MITIPENSSPFLRLMSFDPGTNTLGIAVWEINLITNARYVIFSHTLKSEKAMKPYGMLSERYTDKVVKLHAIENALLSFMIEWDVHVVASESPYFRRMVTAFQALVECIEAIRHATQRYNPYVPLYLIDPARVKNGVGVPGNTGDKSLMRNAVLGMFDGQFTNGIDPLLMDEHAIDAVAVGHACSLDLLP